MKVKLIDWSDVVFVSLDGEDPLMNPHPHHPTSGIFHCYLPPHPPPLPPPLKILIIHTATCESAFATAVCESWNVSDKYTWDNAWDLKQLSMDQTFSEDNRSD